MQIVHAAEIRVLSPTAIEDYHAHLLRLDRASRFPAMDDQSIDSHCLALMASSAILIGAYIKGAIRAGAEIVPDRTARRAEAAITVERGFEDRGLERDLTTFIIEQARRYHLSNVLVHEQSSCRRYTVPLLQLHSCASA
jgi:hypothetical protein